MAGIKLHKLDLRPPPAPIYHNSPDLDSFIAHCSFSGTSIGTESYVTETVMKKALVCSALLAMHHSGENNSRIDVVFPSGGKDIDGYVQLIVRGTSSKSGNTANPALSVEYGRNGEDNGYMQGLGILTNGVLGKTI